MYIIVLSFLTIYACGELLPDYFWSTHFIHFTSPVFKISILLSTLWLCYKIVSSKNNDKFASKAFNIDLKAIGIISFVFMILTIVFAVVKDFYGDSYRFNSFLTKIPKIIPEGTNQKFFSYKLTPWAGEGTILAMVTYIAYYLQITYKTAFVIFNSIFGALFVFTWLHFINHFFTVYRWKIILALAGISAPFVLQFFGHIEIYSPIVFMHLLFGYLTFLYIKTEKKQLLWILVIVLLVNLKLHSVSLLMIPSMLLLLWKQIRGNYPSYKQIWYFIIVPIILMGTILYFFVLQDHIDDRSLQKTAMAFDHTFLPLFSPEAPLDNYNLLSFNHIFDFFSLLFIWSPIALLIFFFIVFTQRKKIKWNTPEIQLSGLSLFLYILFFFMVNPLLSMPIDWDLFSIPAPLLLLFIGSICIQLEKENTIFSIKLLYASILLTVLSLPVFVMHQSEESLSHRLENVAVRIYSTYYEWAAKTADNAFSIGPEAHANRMKRGEHLLVKLKPQTQKGIDYEFSSLLIDQGRYYLRVLKEPKRALILFNDAQLYSEAKNAKLLSLEAYFLLNDYENALKVSKELVQLQFPSAKKAIKMNIHCSLEAGVYNETFEASKTYLKNWPEDTTVKEVFQRISKNDRVRELKFLFHNTNH